MSEKCPWPDCLFPGVPPLAPRTWHDACASEAAAEALAAREALPHTAASPRFQFDREDCMWVDTEKPTGESHPIHGSPLYEQADDEDVEDYIGLLLRKRHPTPTALAELIEAAETVCVPYAGGQAERRKRIARLTNALAAAKKELGR